MSIEQLENDQLVDEEGLSENDLLRAEELRAAHIHNVARRKRHEASEVHAPFEGVRDFSHNWPRAYADMAADTSMAVNEHRNKLAVEKHYKGREGEYQAQAVKDAAAEGVHTDFGTDSKE